VLSGSVWHIVPEHWLAKWRKFIQSRDARRYIPPARLDNEWFWEEVNLVSPRRREQGGGYRPRDCSIELRKDCAGLADTIHVLVRLVMIRSVRGVCYPHPPGRW
jgi:hypothetical protein